MSWGGCLATGCLATLACGRVSLERRLPAEEDCRVTLAGFVTAADALNGLPTAAVAPGDFGAVGCTTVGRTGLGFRDGFLCSAAAVAPGDFGAVGCTTVGRTSLGFRDGFLCSAAAVAPGDFGAVGCTTVGRTSLGFRDGLGSALPVAGRFVALVVTLTTLGRRRSFLAVGVLASLTGPGAGSLAGGDGFLWSFWSAGDGLRTVRAFVATLP